MRATVRIPIYNDDYINRRIESQTTSFEVLRGKISAIITDDEIEEYRNGNITMHGKMSAAIQDVNGFKQQVSELKTAYNAATGEFDTLKSKVSTYEQTVDGFKQQVSSYTKQEVANAKTLKDLGNNVKGISDSLDNYVLEQNLVSTINQAADKISLDVVNTTTLYTKTEVNNKLADYTKTADLNAHIIQNKSSLKLTDEQIIAKVTGSSYWSAQATAIEDLQDTQSEIDKLVESTQKTVNAINNVYYGSSEPKGTTSNPLKTGDLWIDSSKNYIKRYNATSKTWTAVDNKDIATALSTAGTAKAIADGKIKTFTGGKAPDKDKETLDTGDLWFNTAENNKPYRWTGSKWISVQDASIAQAAAIAKSAQSAAAQRIMTFYGSETPTAINAGDIWFNSATKTNAKTGKQYKETVIKRWSGSSWVEIQDTGLETALNAAGTAQATADGKIETFFTEGEPTGSFDEGDLWFDAANNNQCYRYNSTTKKWVPVRDKQILEAYNLAAKKINTYYGTSIPTGTTLVTGDMWIDTTKDSNGKAAKVLKRYNGSKWEIMDSPYLMEAYETACDAADLADCKMQVFYQTSEPKKTASNNLDVGDLWLDSHDKNKMYRWNGSGWDSVEDGYIALAQTTADDAKKLAASKITTYTSNKEPTKSTHPNLSEGDLWYNTATEWDSQQGKTVTKNIVKRWNGASWEDASDSRLASAVAGVANLSDEKAQIFMQVDKPLNNAKNNLDHGDLWIDTSDNNRIYIWNAKIKNPDWQPADAALDELIKWKDEAEIALTKNSIYQTITSWNGGGKELVTMINADSTGAKIKGKHIEIEAGDSITLAITNGSITPYYDSKRPEKASNPLLKKGDIWYDTSSSNYKIWTYTGSGWVETEKDKVPKSGVLAAIRESTEGVKIQGNKIELTAGSEIKLAIDKSTAIGNRNSKTFRTNKEPQQDVDSKTGQNVIKAGDMWIDTGNSNKIYYWDGSNWMPDSIISRINLSEESVSISGDKVNIASNTSFTATVGDVNYLKTNNKLKAKVFRTVNKPLQSIDSKGNRNINVGDIWYDSTTGKNKMWICKSVTNTTADWEEDKIITRINMTNETAKIEAKHVNITAKDLGITAESFRVQATSLQWDSTYSTLAANGIMTFRNASATHQITINAATGSPALNFIRDKVDLGFIGTNHVDDASYRGIVFDLRYKGNYMAWACDSDNNGDFNWKFVYTRNATEGYKANTLTACVPMYHMRKGIYDTGNINTGGDDIGTAGGYISTKGGYISTHGGTNHYGFVKSRFKTHNDNFGVASATINLHGLLLHFEDGILIKIEGTSDYAGYSNYSIWTK